MSLTLIIRPEAEADVLDAFAWYNEQLPGLGQELLAELDRVFAEIVANPEAFPRVHRELRRALVRRFPMGSSMPWRRTGLSWWRSFIPREVRRSGAGEKRERQEERMNSRLREAS